MHLMESFRYRVNGISARCGMSEFQIEINFNSIMEYRRAYNAEISACQIYTLVLIRSKGVEDGLC